ncbi:hypothetical protein D3C80_642940 [compost metagenome]
MRRADGKLLRQHWHHRLYTVEQGKRGKAAAEQRQYSAQESWCAFLDPAFSHSGAVVDRESGDFVGVGRNSSFHG